MRKTGNTCASKVTPALRIMIIKRNQIEQKPYRRQAVWLLYRRGRGHTKRPI